MSGEYKPEVNDYVKWNCPYHPLEGWVYFKCPQYITIEVGTKDKSEQQRVNGTHHRKDHILVLCFSQYWNQLEYVKNRNNTEDQYKSQQYRYSDPQ